MRVLIFGGRNFNSPEIMHYVLSDFQQQHGRITCVIHGKAKGADSWGEWFAINELRVPHLPFPASWDAIRTPGAVIKYTRGPNGKPYNALAGHWRNQKMIDVGRPDWGIRFTGGTGTADMTERLDKAGIPIFNRDRS